MREDLTRLGDQSVLTEEQAERVRKATEACEAILGRPLTIAESLQVCSWELDYRKLPGEKDIAASHSPSAS
jgi:hypothetical protein